MGGFDVTTQAPWLKSLPSAIYKLLAQNWIDYRYPRHLFLETTAACNLTCSYCPRERRGQHMDYRLFTQLVDEGNYYGRQSYSLHLFGEPLLYPRIFDAIRLLKAHHHTVLLTTNGTRLNQCVDELIASRPDVVLWSWRSEATFTPETKKKLRQWGKFRVRFITEVTPRKAYTEWHDWPNVEGRSLHNFGGNIDITKFDQRSNHTIGPSPVSTVERWPCYHLWLAPAIAWNGNLLLCCADPKQLEVLGTFPKQTVHEVWVGDRLRAIRDSHLRGEYGGICAGCDVWKQYPDLFFAWQKRSSS